MMRWSLLLFLCLPFATASAQLDAAMEQRIDTAVQASIQHTGAPSVSVAVVKDGRIVYTKAFGKADIATGAQATPATRYQLASISKTFVAQAVLLLVGEGKLSLEDPISRWFPDLTSAATVTVRQLLAHTSGYPDHYPMGYPAGPRSALQRSPTPSLPSGASIRSCSRQAHNSTTPTSSSKWPAASSRR